MKSSANLRTLRDHIRAVPRLNALSPSLTKLLGLIGAVIVDHLDRHMKKVETTPGAARNGHFWTKLSLSDFVNELQIPKIAIRRALSDLIKDGWVLIENKTAKGGGTGYFYSLDYEKTVLTLSTDCAHIEHRAVITLSTDCAHIEHSEKFSPRGLSARKHYGKPKLAQGLQKREEVIKESDEVRATSLRSVAHPGKKPRALPHQSGNEGEEGADGKMTERSEKAKEVYKATMVDKHREKLNKKVSTTNAIEYWKAIVALEHPDASVTLTKQEMGMMKNLVSFLSGNGINVTEYLSFAVTRWKELRKTLVWGDSKKPRLGEHINFREVAFCKEDIVRAMRKATAPVERAKKDGSDYITYSSVEEVPIDHPDRKRIVAQIEINGKATVKRRE